ncbi:MAG: carbohydrate-binding domain-containing protein [Oscillospiraceae bacterium]|nr:carbohydrate-binding domain-containing protein [Oscillospiraceae bacterium]
MKKLLALLLIAAMCLTLAACGETAAIPTESAEPATSTDSDAAVNMLSATDEAMFSDRDYEVGYSDYVTITLSGETASADGGGVSISGSTVTISQAGAYLLTGSLNGQIIVDADAADKVQLVLLDAAITCDASAAIYCKTADKVFLTLPDGSESSLSSTGAFVPMDDSNIDGAIFSKCDLTMNGSGSLTIRSETGHGVVSKDDLKIVGGDYTVTAASHGLSGKDSVRIAGGVFTITAGKDGIHAENADDASRGFVYIADGAFTMEVTGDAISASATLTVLGGSYDLTSGGGSANAIAKTNVGGDRGSWGGGMKGNMGGMDKMGRGQMPTDFAPATDDAAPTMPANGIPVAPTVTAAVSDAVVIQTASETTEASETSDSIETSAKGLKAAAIAISGGTFTIDAADDAVHSNGDLTVTGGSLVLSSGDDAMHADAALTIEGGDIVIEKSYEGIEGTDIVISGGDISVTSSDDGLNAAASLLISGGTLVVDAAGDGIDSNGSLRITGGTTYVYGPTSAGDGALDYDSTAEISGGIVIAVGAVGMDMNFTSGSTQGAILYALSASQAAGTTVTLTDASGNVLASCTPTKQYQSVLISAPELAVGSTYMLTAGAETVPIALTDLIYGSGNSMGGGKGGGRQFG